MRVEVIIGKVKNKSYTLSGAECVFNELATVNTQVLPHATFGSCVAQTRTRYIIVFVKITKAPHVA